MFLVAMVSSQASAPRRASVAFALTMALGAANAARSQTASLTRTEAPVHEVVLSDGMRRYTVPIKVGSTAIEAGLDTGSTGLRVLPNVLRDGDARPTDRRDSYEYGAGAKLEGVAGEATVAVGALSGSTTLQLVRRVGCSDLKPRCAAGSIPLSQYGIQGDGLPGEGFKAILGVNMARADVASLFAGIGARRWIVDLPRPREPGAGRIVLNPSDEEVQGFVALPIMRRFSERRGGAHDAVEGCLQNDSSHEKFCGAVVLDTGDPGIRIVRPDASGTPWRNGTPATLVFADASGHVRAAETLVIGRIEHASRMSFQRREDVPMTIIFTGLTPYFAYSVLYDPENGTVGFKPRAQMSRGPQAEQVK